jgi:hypothetical protein
MPAGHDPWGWPFLVGWGRVERSMRLVAVVIVDEDPEDPLEMAAVGDQQPVQAFGSDGATKRFADRVRLWRVHRVRMISTLSLRNTMSKSRRVSRSRMTKRTGGDRSLTPRRAGGLAERPSGRSGLAVRPPRCTWRTPSPMKKVGSGAAGLVSLVRTVYIRLRCRSSACAFDSLMVRPGCSSCRRGCRSNRPSSTSPGTSVIWSSPTRTG